jgi:hypothetical protein
MGMARPESAFKLHSAFEIAETRFRSSEPREILLDQVHAHAFPTTAAHSHGEQLGVALL